MTEEATEPMPDSPRKDRESFGEKIQNAFNRIEDEYYDILEKLEEKGIPFFSRVVVPLEKRGIRSFTLAALLMFLIVLGAMVSLTVLSSTGKTVTIYVVEKDKNADDVLVELEADGKVIASTQTLQGVAVFQNVPSSTINVRVTKAGLAPVQRTLRDDATALRIQLDGTTAAASVPLSAGALPSKDQLKLLVLDADSNTPLEDALIEYVSEKASGNLKTSTSGEVLIPASQWLSIRASKKGYKRQTFSVRGGGETTILLKSASSTLFQTPASLATTASATVIVQDQNGTEVEGQVTAYSVEGVKQAEADVKEGLASLRLKKGLSAYVVVQAKGYALYDGSSSPQTIDDETVFQVILQPAATTIQLQPTVIRAEDDKNNRIQFSARILTPSLKTIAEYEGDDWTIDVASGNYLLWVGAKGFFAQTTQLRIGTENLVRLNKATPFNSGKLKVSVKDEYDTPVITHIIIRQNNAILSLPQTTQEDGTTVFESLPLGEVTIEAPELNLASKTKIAEGEQSVLLRVEKHSAWLSAKAFDAVSGSEVAAQFVVEVLGERTDEKTGTFALLKTKSAQETLLTISAEGYLTYSGSFFLADNETKKIDVKLIPKNAVEGLRIEWGGIKNLKGEAVASVKPGQDYIVELNAATSPSAENMSIYLRIGDTGTVEIDIASIVEFSTADEVLKSITYQPAEECEDLRASSVAGKAFKWVELGYKGAAARTASFLIRVNPTAKGNQDLLFSFRATSSAAGIVSRNPPDAKAKACYAATHETKIPIIAATSQTTPTPSPTPTVEPSSRRVPPSPLVEFTKKLDISYNPATGKIELGLEQIVLQVDSLYPKDRLPINFNDQNCRIDAKIESKYPSCFSLTRQALEFRNNDYDSGCPIKVKGNQITMPEGENTLILQATCAAGSPITKIPLVVQTQQVESVVTAPTSLDEGDGTAKLLYVINQKQAGSRTLTPLGAGGTLILPTHAALALSWGGPGTLTLLEEDQTIGEWSYKQAASYFKGKGTVGQRVDSCSDYLCCAQGWCTGSAAVKALSAFREKAAQTAQSTVFRRSDIKAEDKFVFTTVMQLGEDAEKVLSSASIPIGRQGECTPNTPGVYEVTTESSDGKQFEYKARVMKLDNNLNEPSNKIALCNFMYADGKRIVVVPPGTQPPLPAVLSQSNEEHAKPKIKLSTFVQALIQKGICQGLGASKKAACLPGKVGDSKGKAACEAAKKSCKFLSNIPLTEVPPVRIPRFSKFWCASTPEEVQTAKKTIEAAKKAYQRQFGLATEGSLKGAELDFEALGLKDDYVDTEMKGCVALCLPQPACVEIFPDRRQLTYVVHLGLKADCTPFAQNAIRDLATSFVINSLLTKLVPFGGMLQIGGSTCNLARAFWDSQA